MIADVQIVALPTTLAEFELWEPNDGYNGAARAVRMERWRINKIYKHEKKTFKAYPKAKSLIFID